MTDKEIMYANPLEWKLMVAKNTGHTKVTYDELLNELVEAINRQQAELEDARIGVKSYKGKYESAVKTAKELQTLVDEQQAEIEELKKVVIDDYASEYDSKIRAEAIKEFKNKVENDIVTLLGKSNCTDFVNCLDYRYKEMVGEQG